MLSPPRRWTRHTATSHRRDSRTAQATVPNAGPEVRAATRCRGGLEQVRLRSDGVERDVREFEARGAIFEDYDVPTLKTVSHVATTTSIHFLDRSQEGRSGPANLAFAGGEQAHALRQPSAGSLHVQPVRRERHGIRLQLCHDQQRYAWGRLRESVFD